MDAGARTAADITESTGNDHVDVGRLELADRDSIALDPENAERLWDESLKMLG